jgi:hypothetical protein
MPRYSNMHFNVAPRYTGGSPAAVREEIAVRVAQEEKRAYEQVLTGAFGDEELHTAKTKGLKGIAEVVFERGNGWDVKDLCTEEQFRRERLKASKLRPGLLMVRDRDGSRIQPGKRIALVQVSTTEVYVYFGSSDDEGALRRREKAPYELPYIRVSKNEELTVEFPLPEGRTLAF